MGESYWRSMAAPIIRDVLAANTSADEKTIRRALRDAYPFGSRDHHPYRIWCDEIARQRGLKPALGTITKVRPPKENDPSQTGLFV